MSLHTKLKAIEDSLNSEFVEREDEIHGLTLAIMSNTNTLFLGPPGTGKSMLAKRWAAHITQAKFFSWLLSQTTKESEVLGPTDIKILTEKGKEIRNTRKKLPEADVAFLDEIWKSSSALANTLLKIMNERKFDNGVGDEDIPLLTIVAASNELPDTESNLEAAVDRFVLKYEVKPVEESGHILKMFHNHLKVRKHGWSEEVPTLSLEEIKQIREEVKQIEVPEDIMITLNTIQKELKQEKIYVTSRTLNICLQILQSEAYCLGKDTVEEEDLHILINCLWDEPSQYQDVYRVVLDKISPELPKIQSLARDCRTLCNEIEELSKKSDKKTEVTAKGLEAARKLKDAKAEVSRLLKSIQERKKDDSEAKKYEKEIDELLNNLYEHLEIK